MVLHFFSVFTDALTSWDLSSLGQTAPLSANQFLRDNNHSPASEPFIKPPTNPKSLLQTT